MLFSFQTSFHQPKIQSNSFVFAGFYQGRFTQDRLAQKDNTCFIKKLFIDKGLISRQDIFRDDGKNLQL